MNYKELSELLNNNKEQKEVFFKNLNAPEFLPYFIKYNVLNFDNDCGAFVISYLIKILKNNPDLKDEIIKIINHNLKIYNNMSGYVLDSLIHLLKEFSINDIEDKIDYIALFSMDNAYLFDKFLLQNDISNTKTLYKNCVESIISYKQYEDPVWKTKQALSIHGVGIYTISEKLFKEHPYKNNLERILNREDIFEFLLEQYNKIYNEIGDLSFIDRQYIDTVLPAERDDVESYDIRNIIIDCLVIYIKKNNSKNLIQTLLNSKILMIQKLGLYAISLNSVDYKKEFVHFFNNFEEENIQYYIYELMTILENSNMDEETCKLIYERVTGFEKSLRYRILHALKNQALYKDEFYILLNEYGKEIDNPKIIFHMTCSSLKESSPITQTDFAQKSIKEQIDYLNNYKQPSISNIEANNNTIITENELYKIFKNALFQDLDNYIQDDNMYKLEKPEAISTFFDTILSAIVENKNFNITGVLKLLKHYLAKDIKLDTFHFKCTQMLLQLIGIVNLKEDLNSLFIIIEHQIEKWQSNMYTKVSTNLPFDNIRLPIGQYIKIWLICWSNNKAMFPDRETFLNENFNKSTTLDNQLLYYNIGQYYSWFNMNLEDFPNDTLLNAYIEGLINSNLAININFWESFKVNILSYFNQLDKNENNMVRQNFLYSLIHIKFVVANDNLFEYFYQNFSLEDKEDFLWNILYPTRHPKYNKQRILNFWSKEINSPENNVFPILLAMFNEYADTEDFNNYLADLKIFFNKFNLSDENNIKTFLDLQDFLEKYLDFINNNKINQEFKVDIFELLTTLIPVFSKFEYISNTEANLLKNILETYHKQFEACDNIKILLDQIYKTPNLIQYSDIFQRLVLKNDN